jgi:hypothetical protein
MSTLTSRHDPSHLNEWGQYDPPPHAVNSTRLSVTYGDWPHDNLSPEELEALRRVIAGF